MRSLLYLPYNVAVFHGSKAQIFIGDDGSIAVGIQLDFTRGHGKSLVLVLSRAAL